MTDGVSYAGLAAMLSTGGTSVSLGRQTGPGYSVWKNLNLYSDPGYYTSGMDPSRPSNANPWGNYQNAFAASQWDVLTIQPTDHRFYRDVVDEGLETERDEAEIPNDMGFLRVMAANNPNGQVFVYSRAARRTDILADGTPTGLPFDYSTEWMKTYDESAESNLAFFSRSAVRQLMPKLRAAQADDSATDALPAVKLIPVGVVKDRGAEHIQGTDSTLIGKHVGQCDRMVDVRRTLQVLATLVAVLVRSKCDCANEHAWRVFGRFHFTSPRMPAGPRCCPYCFAAACLDIQLLRCRNLFSRAARCSTSVCRVNAIRAHSSLPTENWTRFSDIFSSVNSSICRIKDRRVNTPSGTPVLNSASPVNTMAELTEPSGRKSSSRATSRQCL